MRRPLTERVVYRREVKPEFESKEAEQKYWKKIYYAALWLVCINKAPCCQPLIGALLNWGANYLERKERAERPVGRSHDRFRVYDLESTTSSAATTPEKPAKTSPEQSPLSDISPNIPRLGERSHLVSRNSPDTRRLSFSDEENMDPGKRNSKHGSPRMAW